MQTKGNACTHGHTHMHTLYMRAQTHTHTHTSFKYVLQLFVSAALRLKAPLRADALVNFKLKSLQVDLTAALWRHTSINGNSSRHSSVSGGQRGRKKII